MTAIQNTVNFLAEQVVELRQIVRDIPSEVVDELAQRELNAAVADLSTKLIAYREAYEVSGEQARVQLIESGRLPSSMERVGDRALLAMNTNDPTLIAPLMVAAFKGHIESLILIDAPQSELGAVLDRYSAWFDGALEAQWTRTERALTEFKRLEGSLSSASREILCYYPSITTKLDDSPGHWDLYRFGFARKRIRRELTPMSSLRTIQTNEIDFGDVFNEALTRYPQGGDALTNFLQVRTDQILVGQEEMTVEHIADISAPRTFVGSIARTPKAETWDFIADYPRLKPVRGEHYTVNYQSEQGNVITDAQFPHALRESITGYRVGLDGDLYPTGISTCEEPQTENEDERDAATNLLYAAVSVAVETKVLELLIGVPASILKTQEDLEL